jgi:hypothetical protein
MECRQGCSACCIAPSISSAIPGMEKGKPAGVPCIQLLKEGGCAIFGLPSRPVAQWFVPVYSPSVRCAVIIGNKPCFIWQN